MENNPFDNHARLRLSEIWINNYDEENF